MVSPSTLTEARLTRCKRTFTGNRPSGKQGDSAFVDATSLNSGLTLRPAGGLFGRFVGRFDDWFGGIGILGAVFRHIEAVTFVNDGRRLKDAAGLGVAARAKSDRGVIESLSYIELRTAAITMVLVNWHKTPHGKY